MDAVLAGFVAFEFFFLVIKVWALVRALSRPAWAFERAGKNKAFWLIVLIVAFFLPVLGALMALGYLFSTDRKVHNQQQVGPGIGFPGGP